MRSGQTGRARSFRVPAYPGRRSVDVMTDTQRPFRWRSVILVALLPTALFSIGEGAIIPVLPVVAGDVGATLAVAGLIGAALLFGELLGDIPSGVVVARIGERSAML